MVTLKTFTTTQACEVQLIANTDNGCIVEIIDGFAVNIGPCEGEAGDYIVASYDVKVKERAALMNP